MLAKAIEAAIRAARKSTHKTYFHGSAVVIGNTVVAEGWNWENGIHSEVHAVGRLHPSKRKNLICVNVRLTKGGLLADSKPCINCQIFLKSQGVTKVYFSNAERVIDWMRL